MLTEFDICGVHIPYSDIKDYQLVQREYIYRPAYYEKNPSIVSLFSASKYEFGHMTPYAAILTKEDKEYKLATREINALNIGGAIIKDVFLGVATAIGSKLNRKFFRCKNVSGRVFATYLDDVPAVLTRCDGKVSDVYKYDSLYRLLGEPIAPSVQLVPALMIVAKKTYIFYGNGIHLTDVNDAYYHLRQDMEIYKAEKLTAKKHKQLKIEVPNFVMKLVRKPDIQPQLSEDQESENVAQDNSAVD